MDLIWIWFGGFDLIDLVRCLWFVWWIWFGGFGLGGCCLVNLDWLMWFWWIWLGGWLDGFALLVDLVRLF